MKWSHVIIGTVFALSWPVFMTWWRRKERGQVGKQPTYEELRTERDVLFFDAGFLSFWVFLAAPYIDWTYFGEYTRAYVSITLIVVFVVSRRILHWMDRPRAHT
ncbi:MAG TPA: hypothetical protein VGL38_13540 [bacterium]|jgi:hypothetical protein